MNGNRNRKATAAVALALVALLGLGIEPSTASAQTFPTVFNLSSLDGRNGYRLDGEIGEWSSWSVAAARDINGDGIDDMVIGSPYADTGAGYAGRAYVVFGQANPGFPMAARSLASLDGSNGFRIDGDIYVSKLGNAVSSAGDINGDGIADLAIGAPDADGGVVYVIFGRAGGNPFPAEVSLNSLDGMNGFSIAGSEHQQLGWSVSTAGDLNDDGIEDLIIGAPGYTTATIQAGNAYVVFGHPKGVAFAPSMSVLDLDGQNGFRFTGVLEIEGIGSSVSFAGDVNGDGVGDVMIGAPFAGNAAGYSGSSYVLFGRASPATFDPVILTSSLDGASGFRLDGEDAQDRSGWIVNGTGDVNGDGIDDMAIGDFYASQENRYAGKSYVVFGRASGREFGSVLSLSALDGQNGFRIDGAGIADKTGSSISGAGDINGDGVNDLILGADKTAASGVNPAATYVVFGHKSQTPFPPVVALASLDSSIGFRMNPEAADDSTGRSVSAAGDVNNDGIDDFIVGAPLADAQATNSNCGSSYVIFGNDTLFAGSFE